jgi:hypothetical protein
MSRVRVNGGQSVLHDGIWYDQRAEFECDDPKEYGAAVTVIDAPKPSKTKPELSAPAEEEK